MLLERSVGKTLGCAVFFVSVLKLRLQREFSVLEELGSSLVSTRVPPYTFLKWRSRDSKGKGGDPGCKLDLSQTFLHAIRVCLFVEFRYRAMNCFVDLIWYDKTTIANSTPGREGKGIVAKPMLLVRFWTYFKMRYPNHRWRKKKERKKGQGHSYVKLQ